MENIATKKSLEFVGTAVATERLWCKLLLMELASTVPHKRDDLMALQNCHCTRQRHQKSAKNAEETPQHDENQETCYAVASPEWRSLFLQVST